MFSANNVSQNETVLIHVRTYLKVVNEIEEKRALRSYSDYILAAVQTPVSLANY
jgi:hypothetical protein